MFGERYGLPLRSRRRMGGGQPRRGLGGRPTTGKHGEQGRFVTLKSGRAIFIPHGKKTRWADVRDKIKAAAPTPTTAMKQVPGGGLREPKTGEKKERLARTRKWREWENAGLKPRDFGVSHWSEIDPEVVEDVLRRAKGPKPKLGKKRKIKVGGRTYNIPEVR